MELKPTVYEEFLLPLKPGQCIPLGDTSPQSIYTAIRLNKDFIEAAGMKFKIQTDPKTDKKYVCRKH